MNGTSISSSTSVLQPFAQEWRMKGTGDFDNDLNIDIMVEQDGTGGKGIWYLNKTSLRDGFTYLTLQPEWESDVPPILTKMGVTILFFCKSSGKVIVFNLSNQSPSDNDFDTIIKTLDINRNFIPAGNTNASSVIGKIEGLLISMETMLLTSLRII